MSNICDAPKVIAPIGLSDHNSVLCVLKKSKSMNKRKKIQIRPRNSSAKRAFGRWLTNYYWSNLYHTTLCEQKLELFQDVISTGLDHFLPCKVVQIHDRDNNTRSVPDVWKKADAIPVPKNKAPSDINKDLRPISLTATLSKTCERFVADWLMQSIGEKIDKKNLD